MSLSLILACVWALVANVLAMTPSRDYHWRNAYVLIGLGVPLLAFVVWQNGWIVGIVVLIAAMSVLRWPVIYLMRWIRRVARALGAHNKDIK